MELIVRPGQTVLVGSQNLGQLGGDAIGDDDQEVQAPKVVVLGGEGAEDAHPARDVHAHGGGIFPPRNAHERVVDDVLAGHAVEHGRRLAEVAAEEEERTAEGALGVGSARRGTKIAQEPVHGVPDGTARCGCLVPADGSDGTQETSTSALGSDVALGLI